MATDVLPNELLARVLCVLPPRDLCQAHRVCRRWAALLRDDDDDDHDHGGGGGGGGNASVVWRDAFRHTWKCDAPFLWTTTSSTGSRSSWRKEYLRRAWLVGCVLLVLCCFACLTGGRGGVTGRLMPGPPSRRRCIRTSAASTTSPSHGTARTAAAGSWPRQRPRRPSSASVQGPVDSSGTSSTSWEGRA